MPVYFIRESGVGKAVFRSTDESEDVFCGSVSLNAYDDPQVCEAFATLVNAVAAHFRRQAPVAAVDRDAQIAELLPYCSRCSESEAAEILHWARQASDLSKIQMSPSGLYPMGCCRVKTVGAYTPDSPQPAARR
jgi:hypothetical protein